MQPFDISTFFIWFRDLIFERAYCEYRLNRIEDAFNTLKNVERELDEREQELFAQVVSRTNLSNKFAR